MVLELRALIGKRYHYSPVDDNARNGGLVFHVRVIDARYVYGSIHVKVTPATDGTGDKWVNVRSLGREVTP